MPARLLLGRVYLELKDPKAAEDQFEAATLLDSKNLDAEVGIAQCEIAEGNQAVALGQLKALSASHPKEAQIFDVLAEAYRSLGKDQDANQAEAHAKLLRRTQR